MIKLINRPQYLNELISYKDKDVIKVVTGIRRCGKSSILNLYHEYLNSIGINEKQIIHINLESLNFIDIKEDIDLYEYVKKHINKNKRTYLIFDEIQSVNNWQRAIESFRLDFDCDIYITGSNAYLLSSELSTLLSGRFVQIKIYPLSFKEFLTFNTFDSDYNIDKKFLMYIKFGGMPIISTYNFDEHLTYNTLEDIYNTIAIKDIIQRNNLVDNQMLERIILYIADNIGNITSANKISNVLVSDKEIDSKSIQSRTVEKYLTFLENSFLINKCKRYDIKGKELLKSLDKYYILDLGFRNMLLGFRNIDRGHILENIIYVELLRRGYKVYIGKLNDKEVDFVCENQNERKYIQVCETLVGEDVRKREFTPLLSIDDNYEKIVLSMDYSIEESYNGIKIMNIIDWLLK